MFNQSSILQTIASFLRLPNVVLIIFLSFVFRFRMIKPLYQLHDSSYALTGFEFAFLVIDVVLVTWIGYWMNDWEDRSIDRINKPDRLLARTNISKTTFFGLIATIALLCAGVTIYVAISTDNLEKLLLLPIAVALVAAYARWLKAYKIWGNILVSLLVVSVIGIHLLSEWPIIQTLPNDNFILIIVLSSLALFIFNWAREIVKDVEDLDGDEQNFVKSIPILLGLAKARQIVFLLMMAGLIPILYLGITYTYEFIGILLTIFSLVIWFRTLSMVNAMNQKSASRISKQLKLLLIAGIMLMAFLSPI